MAVEARRLCLFTPQILDNRGMLNVIEGVNNNFNTINNNMMYGEPFGSTTTTTAADALIPPASINGKTVAADWTPVKTAMKSDSGLTCSIPILASRKRPRDPSYARIANCHRNLLPFPANLNSSERCTSVATFLGEDISLRTQQHQLEIDQFISHHAAKVRKEIEEQRKDYSLRVIRAVEESLMKRLRAKEEEIENIGKLNWALAEKVRSLCAENQIWRELAQSNEATANALRNILEQVVLAQAQQVEAQLHYKAEGLMDDEAQSCCGSNYYLDMGKGGGEGAEQVERNRSNNDDIGKRAINEEEEESGSGRRRRRRRWCRVCRNCGKEEASVLLLPCRHLCLCYACGPALDSCPVCLSTKNAALHINLSSHSSST
ncbi:probable BOI-related E3 ubiquitin-protein ligase 3 [Coffea arabica]|uniref:Probable BOI-related E3 ubiquitin-protein ligase 3 n=1 Tax=Coffea arabica TaxID=13443 RepID=A0A6P6XKA4_COFAR|nr:probable BOI-related E3 ubiquitin-protein ligase 3 [Coffea arabica]